MHAGKWTFAINATHDAKSAAGADTLKVFGYGSVAADANGQLVVDHHADVIEPESLEAAVYDFVKAGRDLDAHHDGEQRGVLIESVFVSPEKRKAMQVGDAGPTGWFTGWELHDQKTIAAVKAGELKELSIEYSAERHELPEDQPKKTRTKSLADRPVGRLRNLKLHRLSLVDVGAGKGVEVTLFKRREEDMSKKNADPAPAPDATPKMSLEEALKMVPAEARAAIEAAIAGSKPKPEGEGEPSVPPKSREVVEAEKARDEMKARIVDLENAAKHREYVDSVKALDLEYLPGATVEQMAKSLRVIDQHIGGDDAKALRAMLVGAAKAIKDGALLKTHGAGGAGVSSVLEVVESKARELMAKEPGLALHQAKAKVWDTNPDLYHAYTAEGANR